MTQSATGTFEQGMNGESHRRGCGGRSGCGKGLKSPWSAWEIGAMVAGFVIFWPIGIVALILKWKNGEMWKGASASAAPWAGFRKPDLRKWQPGYSMSGNAAFDDYKRAELDKIEALRRKLEDDQKAFGDFVERLRRAKDQDEFERFMAERSVPGPLTP